MATVKTKIVATLGPASSNETMLRKMIQKGLDVVRLNFSHGTVEEHLQRFELVRSLNTKMKRAVKILQDLEGYRIRIGKMARPVILAKGARIFLTQENIEGDEKIIPFDYEGPLDRIGTGHAVYIDDGRIVLEVKEIESGKLKCKVAAGGFLKEHKGINIPEAKLDFDALTEKDRNDLAAGLPLKPDYVAQSFVRNAGDIRLVKEIVKPVHNECGVFAKIESREALENLDSIIDESDGILVARGDLGICVPIYKIPVLQKQIVAKCRAKNKPVIVATQMLESMTEERIPTRAEVTDVANAIFDGASHVMLSAETAVGKHPDKVVDMMNKIIKYSEEYSASLGF